jgi:hypothetical protein
MAKRTVIAPDEELIVKGILRVTGDLIQENTTVSVTNLAGNIFTVNSDGDNVTSSLVLNSNNDTATLSFLDSADTLTVSKSITASSGFIGNLTGNVTGAPSSLAGLDTADLAEGSNLYFTTARARASLGVTDSGGDGSLTYNSGTGIYTYTGPSLAEAQARIDNSASNVRAHFSAGTNTTYSAGVFDITDATIRGKISVTDSGGDGSLSYNNSTGVITYTGPSASEVRAHFSGSTGISISSGAVSISATGVGAASYGSATAIPTYTVNAQGQLTAAADVSIAIPKSQLTNFDSEVRTLISVSDAGGDGSLAYNNSTGVITYTGPSASEVRAHFTGGTGIDISSGTVAIDSTVVTKADTQTINGAKTFTGTVNLTGATVTVANSNVAGQVAQVGFVNSRIQDVLGAAPAALDTLGEIATALNDDANIGGVVTNNTSDITTLQNRNINTGTGLSGGGNLTADRTLTTNDSQIVHDNLSGFVANEHIDHSGVTLTAGSGLTGGGDITASRTFNIGAGDGITVNADSISTNDSAIVLTALSGYVANQHIDHTSVSITAGNGLSGGGDISATRSIALDLNELTAATVDVANDSVAIIDATDNSSKKESIADLVSAIAGSGLNATNGLLTTTGFSGDIQSVDVGATGVDILQGSETLGNGTIRYYIRSIDGGTYTNATESGNVITIDGDINAIRGGFSGSGLLSYNSGTGAFTTTADNYASWKFTTGSAGNVDISSNELLTFSGGSGISVSHSGSTITVTNTNTADITGVGAGAGMTGGGTNGDVTLNVIGGDGITVAADEITTDDTYIKALFSGGTGITYSNGAISLTDTGYVTGVTAGSGLAGGGTSGTVTLTHADTSSQASVNNSGRTYIQDVTLDTYGHVTGLVSATETVVNTDTNTTYTAGTGLTLVGTEFRSTITQYVDADARGAISVTDSGGDGSLSYNSTSGAITYTGPSAAQVRAHFSAGTGISISSGSISTDDSAINIHNLSGYVANENIDHSSVTLTAGAGLTGGGTIASNRTFTVGAGSYITVNADDVAVDATTTNTASKVVARDASGNFAAGTITATATQAQYADLAEKYEADADYEPGTVLIIGGDKEVTVTDQAGSYYAVGVVSTDPAYLMNAESNGVAVALRGRIPCKVVGKVTKGDVIVTSHTLGHGMVAGMFHTLSPLQIIGRSLENKTDVEPGIIEIIV